MIEGYGIFLSTLRVALLYLAIAAAVVCVVDWAVRTRRLSPFSGIARVFRTYVDPLMRPAERALVRAGGLPSSAPWWTLAGIVVGGILALYVFQLVGDVLVEADTAARQPRVIPILLLSWAISLLTFALIVRVVSSWVAISPFSKWVRWSYVLTEWMLAPLRRIVPPFGVMDVTPLVAYLILSLLRVVLIRSS